MKKQSGNRDLDQRLYNLVTFYNSIDLILMVADHEGRIVETNKAGTNLLGYSNKELAGKYFHSLFIAGLKPEIEELINRARKKGNGIKVLPLIAGGGLTITSEISVSTGEWNEQESLFIIIKDITKVTLLEKELHEKILSLDAAVNGTGSGLWDWNMSTDELILNDNWFDMLGFTRDQFGKIYDKFGYKTFADFVHPEDLVKVEKELEKHFRRETDYYRLEIRMKTIDNSWKWILAAGKVWEWDNDKPVRMIGIHTDIDYRIRIEDQLKVAINKAEESDKLKTAFLANISHEIRTPMNGIVGFLELLENPGVTGEQRDEYMRFIKKSSTQLLNIINDVVDISKIETGQITLHEASVDLDQLLGDLLTHYKSILKNKDVVVTYDLNLSEGERMIIVDETKLRQILSNLISNAIKFTPKGRIQVSCKKADKFIQFCVCDTGSGIPEYLHKEVFERFRQVDYSMTRLKEGAGLGLSISKAYIEKMGGSVWLKSEADKGSEFFFTIPFKKAGAKTVKESGNRRGGFTDNATILVVEDEVYNFMFVEQIIQKMGYKVLHAENGEQALQMVETVPDISLVLMDIRLPGMDGYEATTRIKKLNRNLPVIALTALALSGDRERALDAGCDDYLKKPILMEELEKTIRIYLPV
ncbi:MAG: response regulator [Bacteroidales bacterium]|nr:response regulator [Bacteroidales bacterium]